MWQMSNDAEKSRSIDISGVKCDNVADFENGKEDAMTKLQKMNKSSDGGELSAFLGSGAMMRRYTCLAAALIAVSAQAFNWSDYSEGADVLVTANATATDSDMATINSYSMLRFASGTTITFNISGDASLSCPVAATGTIVKCGTGSLTIATSSQNGRASTFQYVDFDVEEGDLKAPQENASGSEFWTGKVTVGENGTFFTARSRNTCIYGGLWGSGVITNIATDGKSQLRVMNESYTPCVFSGRILGSGIRWYSGGNVHLTGTNSLFSGSFQLWSGNDQVTKRGTTGFVKIGNAGEESSIGSRVNDLVSREMGSRYLYLGEGETTSRTYSYYNNHSGAGSTCMHYWDAGAHGGITFTGKWNHGNAHSERLVLMGSNTAPCVIAGEWTGDNATNATYVIKRGSGTWRLAHNSNRTLSGTIAVEDGTLEFETIAEVGENCSLGRATCHQSSYTGKYDASKNVDYAYLLGTTSTTGTMSFVGTSSGACRSRPFAVQGRGCVRNAGLGGQLGLGGAFAATAAGGTLVLDAEDGTMNAFSMVRDGDHGGVLSLEKTGAGTWALEGTNTFSGALAVKEGTLVVRNLPYSWFRFTVMETQGGRQKRLGTADPDSNIEIQELALYSADGVRRNVNMTFHTTYDNWTALPVGHACWARGGTINYYTNRNGDKMFDEVGSGTGCCVVFNSKHVRLDDSSTWIPVLMHMDPGGELITMFDIVNVNARTYARTPIAYKMEASRDGYSWTQVFYETNSLAAEQGRWHSDPSESFTAGAVRPGKGFSVSNCTFAANEMLPNVSGVSVAPNAVIAAEGPVTLKTLSVDASGAGNGTVRGFSFAEAGTLRIEGLGALAGKCEIPMALEDCTGLENVSKWSLVVNGEAGNRYHAKARADGIVVTAVGTLVIMK